MFDAFGALHWIYDPHLGPFEFGQRGALVGGWRLRFMALLCHPLLCFAHLFQRCGGVVAVLHPVVFGDQHEFAWLAILLLGKT